MIAKLLEKTEVYNQRISNYICLFFYRCTVHLEDSLIITPTNAPVYNLLI